MTLDTSKLQEAFSGSLASLSLMGLLSSALILLICLIVIRIVMALVNRLLDKTKLDARMEKFIAAGIKTLLYIFTVLIVADSLGIPVTSLIALVSVFGLAISLAVQDVLSNVASGMVILFSHPFAPDDYIATDDGEGTVTEIGLTHTKLDTANGQRIMLPNSKLVAGKIINYTTRGVRRVNHVVTASYDSATEDVRRACLKAVERTAGVLADPSPVVVVTRYGDSAIEYNVRFWTRTEDYWDAHNGSLEELRRCFDEEGVDMTYNHLNVHILDKTNEK